MLEIDLIRHVKVEGKPALYGCTDVKPVASENARLLERLVTQQQTNKAYQGVFCSPLIRCQLVAQEFSLSYKLPLKISLDLQEMNFGCFDGVPFDDLSFRETAFHGGHHGEDKTELHWAQLEAFFRAPADIILPEAEALSDFNYRVTKAWRNLLEEQVAIATKQKGSPTPRRILVVVHGGVIRMILAHILQLNWQQSSWHQNLKIGYGSMSRVVISQPYQDPQLHQQVTSIATPFVEEL
ncbi:histidine phosphatase family protein [Colwellia sp. 12G3]|uniref:histidine phosphatase family protein n=1 Tax=Colwellia sp. 12G3 TaxID=2058299 RepID=UPI000C34D5FD|nr:histidine phosphatase family protein [Colwellia sp. 12G3]PKI17023.1 phosphoglycerate mutase [Colwellia sp. 12G3]